MSPWNAATFGASALLIAAAAVVASALPVLRATRIDPLVSISGE